jgi:hypothetical protein
LLRHPVYDLLVSEPQLDELFKAFRRYIAAHDGVPNDVVSAAKAAFADKDPGSSSSKRHPIERVAPSQSAVIDIASPEDTPTGR